MRILRRSDTFGLVELEECATAVEEAFRLHGNRRSLDARRLHVSALAGGVFHITAGGLARTDDDGVVGIKVNGRFPPLEPGSGQRVSGSVLLADAVSGAPLALIDSMLVTLIRTAAVTVIVARRLAREDAANALIVGAGRQAKGQVDALRLSGRVSRIGIHDVVRANADRVAEYARSQGLDGHVVDDVHAEARRCDVVVTVTPATAPILQVGDIAPGALVVALGADGPGKQELDPQILAGSRVVVDILEQAQEAGELQHALSSGLLERGDVYAELGELVAGSKPGRSDVTETFVFDATGTALQDVAAAELLLRAAEQKGLGLELDLAG